MNTYNPSTVEGVNRERLIFPAVSLGPDLVRDSASREQGEVIERDTSALLFWPSHTYAYMNINVISLTHSFKVFIICYAYMHVCTCIMSVHSAQRPKEDVISP